MFLEDGDIVLRPVEKDDAGFLRDNVQLPELRQWFAAPPLPKNLEQEEKWIERKTESDESLVLMIEYEEDTVGEISLEDIDRINSRARFGMFIAPEHHGKGIGTAAARLLINHAFRELGLHRIEGGFIEGNEASRGMQEKLGLEKEGRKGKRRKIRPRRIQGHNQLLDPGT